MQQRTLDTDAPVSARRFFTAGHTSRRDPAPRVDVLPATVGCGVAFVDTADIHGRHADYESVGETRTVLATERYGTAPTLPVRPFPRVRS